MDEWMAGWFAGWMDGHIEAMTTGHLASMKALVPDFAMVPKLLINSFLVMPMPESSMVKVELVLSGMILMKEIGLVEKVHDHARSFEETWQCPSRRPKGATCDDGCAN